MNCLLVTDIFGDGPWLQQVRETIEPYAQITCVSPYSSKQAFDHEHQAYQAYCQDCGHENYLYKVRAALQQLSTYTLALGFSAGASALWRALSDYSGDHVQHFIGFYPGQIRNALALNTQISTTLVFPSHESHFDLVPVKSALRKKDKVEVLDSAWLHGFMNPCSEGFHVYGQKMGLEIIEQKLMLMRESLMRAQEGGDIPAVQA